MHSEVLGSKFSQVHKQVNDFAESKAMHENKTLHGHDDMESDVSGNGIERRTAIPARLGL